MKTSYMKFLSYIISAISGAVSIFLILSIILYSSNRGIIGEYRPKMVILYSLCLLTIIYFHFMIIKKTSRNSKETLAKNYIIFAIIFVLSPFIPPLYLSAKENISNLIFDEPNEIILSIEEKLIYDRLPYKIDMKKSSDETNKDMISLYLEKEKKEKISKSEVIALIDWLPSQYPTLFLTISENSFSSAFNFISLKINMNKRISDCSPYEICKNELNYSYVTKEILN